MTDEDGIVKYSSPIISDILGRSRESILDTPITSLIEQKSRALAEKALTSKGRKLAFTDMQAMLLNADNELVPMEFSAIPVFNEQFQFKGYRGVARNISDRIEAEQIRQNYQLTLERQVEERTQDLNDINEELKNFTYIVSHDLRSPLVSIVGFSSEIRDDIALLQHKDSDFDSEVKQIVDNNIPESLAFIDKAAEKMERLINSILALSRIGRRDLVFEKVDTQSVVENNLKAIAFQLENINVTVHELPVITSDLSAIEQIFGNLIGNAAKYLEPTRKGEIEIWAEQIQHGWEFYVKDNGKGIATNDIPHVFDLFKRVGNHDVQGEGMGLTYVQSLIRRLNGRIECQSVLGEETTFRFSLPIDE
jgi:PAS domain S-box-containing protein